MALLALVFVAGAQLAGWLYMWTIATTLFLSAKWITIFPLLVSANPMPSRRGFYYFFFWIGLNADQFIFGNAPAKPSRRPWVWGIAKTILGVALVVAAIGWKHSDHILLVGWTAMIGLVLLLHFGLFHLLALFWQTRGYNAQPIMNMPLRSVSLGRLWSGRWNRAFSDFGYTHIFRPLSQRLSARASLLAVFVISGLLHETVITIPAGGAYGFPTGYFLLQGLGHFAERSAFGQQIGLGRGRIGWAFVVLVSGLPAFILFPPVFIRNVVIPMLEAL